MTSSVRNFRFRDFGIRILVLEFVFRTERKLKLKIVKTVHSSFYLFIYCAPGLGKND